MGIVLGAAAGAAAQASLQWDYIGTTSLRNHADEDCGRGNLQRVKLGLTLPVKMVDNKWGGRDMYGIAAAFTNAWLNNYGLAHEVNPERIVNATVSFMFMRALGEKWGIIGAAGAGIYAPSNYIRWKSVLANAGVIFTYKVNEDFTWGIGGGLTNSYGVPMILPMAYIDWKHNGKVKLTVNMSTGIKATASLNLSKRIRLDFVPIEFDALTAVIEHDGREKLYSMLNLRSNASINFKLNKDIMLFVGAGGAFVRKLDLKNRRLSNIFHTGDKNKYHYRAAPQVSCGIIYKPQF